MNGSTLSVWRASQRSKALSSPSLRRGRGLRDRSSCAVHEPPDAVSAAGPGEPWRSVRRRHRRNPYSLAWALARSGVSRARP
jgi:hypothetical protein